MNGVLDTATAPLLLVTMIGTRPAALSTGTVTVIELGVELVTLAPLGPKRTLGLLKPVPVIVRGTPPAIVADVGLNDVIDGAVRPVV